MDHGRCEVGGENPGMETFDRKRLPAKLNVHVNVLLEGSFMDRAEIGQVFGNPGSGKTHLLCTIALALVQQGRCILFTSCNLLVQNLLVSKRGQIFKDPMTTAAAIDRLVKVRNRRVREDDATFSL
jgi:DNA replication protein DnaC